MKLTPRLVIYYLIATLLSTFIVGMAVLKGIQSLSMGTIEQQLIEQSKLAEIYISQVAFIDNPDEDKLSVQTSGRIITNLSLVLGNIHIYDTNFNPMASSKTSIKSTITKEENEAVLSNALQGNYAYLLRDNSVYFASPLDIQGKTVGLLEIIYPMNFLTTLIRGVMKILLWGAVGLAVLMTLLSVYIAGRVTKPIKQLVTAANHYARRDFIPIEIKSSDEIAQLCHSFNAMGAQLKEYIQRQKLFVSNVSHELRTPLTAIKGYSEYLRDEVKGTPDLEKAVFHLNNESARLAKLVDEVLTLSRIDSGRESFEMEKINISGLVEETIEKMSVRAEKYGIKVEREIAPGMYVLGDAEKLTQVFVNLLDNAIKFSPVNALVRVRMHREDSMVVITISDQGMGIPSDQISKVFERFYRADNAKGVSGTGLGLSIVKHIVEEHKGSIDLVSDANEGTTAILKLPGE